MKYKVILHIRKLFHWVSVWWAIKPELSDSSYSKDFQWLMCLIVKNSIRSFSLNALLIFVQDAVGKEIRGPALSIIGWQNQYKQRVPVLFQDITNKNEAWIACKEQIKNGIRGMTWDNILISRNMLIFCILLEDVITHYKRLRRYVLLLVS